MADKVVLFEQKRPLSLSLSVMFLRGRNRAEKRRGRAVPRPCYTNIIQMNGVVVVVVLVVVDPNFFLHPSDAPDGREKT